MMVVWRCDWQFGAVGLTDVVVLWLFCVFMLVAISCYFAVCGAYVAGLIWLVLPFVV